MGACIDDRPSRHRVNFYLQRKWGKNKQGDLVGRDGDDTVFRRWHGRVGARGVRQVADEDEAVDLVRLLPPLLGFR